MYKILLDKSSVAVRLIGSHLFLAKNGSASCPWFFTQFSVIYYHYESLTFFWSTYPLFFLLDSFAIFAPAFSGFQHRVLTPVRADLLGAAGSVSASRRKVQWGARLRPENPGRSWVFLRAVFAVQLVVSADLVLQRASRVVKNCF